MNVLSLFDGMSCGRIALERAGIPVTNYFASEIDPYAIKVSKANWPDITHLGSVTGVSVNYFNDEYRTFLTSCTESDIIFDGKINILIGGSPCQGFSKAGKQLNFNDPRSALFFEYVRILNEILAHNKNLLFLLENVNMKKEWQDVITDLLGIKPIYIDSEKYSAAARRRLYWTNIPIEEMPGPSLIKLSDIIENGYVDRDKAYCIDANYYKGGSVKQYLTKKRRQLVMRQSEKILMVNLSNEDVRKLTVLECERCLNIPENYTFGVSTMQRYKMIGNGWEINTLTNLFKNIPIG